MYDAFHGVRVTFVLLDGLVALFGIKDSDYLVHASANNASIDKI